MHNDKCTRLLDTLGYWTLFPWCVVLTGGDPRYSMLCLEVMVEVKVILRTAEDRIQVEQTFGHRFRLRDGFNVFTGDFIKIS